MKFVQLVAGHSGSFGGQVHGFYSDIAPDYRIVRTVDHTHGAAAQFFADFVTPSLGYGVHGGLTLRRKNLDCGPGWAGSARTADVELAQALAIHMACWAGANNATGEPLARRAAFLSNIALRERSVNDGEVQCFGIATRKTGMPVDQPERALPGDYWLDFEESPL